MTPANRAPLRHRNFPRLLDARAERGIETVFDRARETNTPCTATFERCPRTGEILFTLKTGSDK